MIETKGVLIIGLMIGIVFSPLLLAGIGQLIIDIENMIYHWRYKPKATPQVPSLLANSENVVVKKCKVISNAS